MTIEKAQNAGVSLFPSEIVRFKLQASARDGGSLTKYFRRLAQEDGAAKTQASDGARILDSLAVQFAGYLAPTLAKQLAERAADQSRLLHAILLQLSDYFARGGRVQDLALVDRAHASFAPLPPHLRSLEYPTPKSSDLIAAEDPAR